MNVLIMTRRFRITPDGHLWNASASLGYAFWQRYLEDFDNVHLLARVTPAEVAPEGWHRATGDRVIAAPVPDFSSPLSLLRRLSVVIRALRSHLASADALILRSTSDAFPPLLGLLIEKGRPYAIELVGDPYEAFSPGAMRLPLRRLYQGVLTWFMKRLCRKAAAISHVTETVLQKRYPAGPNAFQTHYSSIDLPEERFVQNAHHYEKPLRHATLTFVGTLENLSKGQDVLLDAIAIVNGEGLELELNLVGKGVYRDKLVTQAKSLGITDRVTFHGQIDPARVLALLDASDLFVLPSRNEGLPRAMIEAMARGLPCIGTTIAGFPELLPDEVLVRPCDSRTLAELIENLLANPDRMNRLAAENLNKAHDFQDVRLRQRRRQLYRAIIDSTTQWQSSRNR